MMVDLVVIGAGAAGLAAAREGIRRRASVFLVTEGPPGGECTFTGCVPSKTLIADAARGVAFGDAIRRVRATVEAIAGSEDEEVLRSEGIQVARGRATFRSPRTIEVDGTTIDGRRFVIATGSRSSPPPIKGIDGVGYLTHEKVFELDELPPSLAVLGGGPVGCELAQAFARFGSRVTLIEREDSLLPTEEAEVSGTLLEVFEREGVTVVTGTSATKIEPTAAGIRVHLGSRESVEAAALLVASGMRAATDHLDLGAAGVKTDPPGWIRTDATLATTAKGIWAAGDVTGRSPFTHAADEMGRIAAANALSRARKRFDVRAVPFVVFTDPEVARVGCTTKDAGMLRGGRTAFRPMTDVDRAMTEDRTDGFVKLIGAKRRLLGNVGGGRLMGATIVCARAGELVNEAALAIQTKMFLGRLAQAIHAYPTWSTSLRQTASQFFGYGDGARPL
jgi:pyruvate/2-oxoglutarate dehydrogenase complex dihydrolipoamide dehydrogenase (E3) component